MKTYDIAKNKRTQVLCMIVNKEVYRFTDLLNELGC